MLARLLYAAIGLSLLGTVPEHAGQRRATIPDAAALAPPPPAPAGIGRAAPDFAIPRIQR